MKIVVKNDIAVLSGENIYYDGNLVFNNVKYVDLDETNSSIVDDVTLPENYVDGLFFYRNGEFEQSELYNIRIEQIKISEENKAKENLIADITSQISTLESKITPRRIREALLSGDNSFIEAIESQISELRTQLV